MSALPLKEDMLSVSIDVRLVPIADISLQNSEGPNAFQASCETPYRRA